MSTKRKHMDEEPEIDPGSIPLPDDDCNPTSTFPPLPPSPPPPPSPPAASEYILEPESIPIPDTIPGDDNQQPTTTSNQVSETDLKQFLAKASSSSTPPRKRRPHNPDETVVTLEDKEMSKLLGFSNFDSTKGKQVPGNNQIGAVHVVKKRRYRQYMNRKGGFNRPLDKVA